VAKVDAACSDVDVADMLRQVHDALRGCPTALPSYATAVDQARATLAVDPALLALTSLLNSARVGDVYFFRAGHHLVYEEASEILELNPAAALQQVMDHVHESSMKAADDGG
jgi:hypothetical protein